jgi:hypothetical protein
MDQRIIYRNEDGGVAIVVPAPDFLQDHTIDYLVSLTVPPGVPYKIVAVDEIPSDRTFRDAWEYKE